MSIYTFSTLYSLSKNHITLNMYNNNVKITNVLLGDLIGECNIHIEYLDTCLNTPKKENK